MKPKSVPGISRNPKELTFAWVRGDEALVRFWCALLLAAGILVALWLSIRVVVPASMASDRPRVEPAQLVLLSEQSHPSLRKLLLDKSLPSLGVQDGVAEAPMLDGMLRLLGLEEEVERTPNLYPEVVIEPSLAWPQEAQSGFTLPELPEINEDSWPRIEEPADLRWEVRLKGNGGLSEILKEKVLPWTGAVPAIRSSEWSVVLERDGSLAFAGAVDGVEGEIEEMIRQKLEGVFEGGTELEEGVEGIVELRFKKKTQ